MSNNLLGSKVNEARKVVEKQQEIDNITYEEAHKLMIEKIKEIYKTAEKENYDFEMYIKRKQEIKNSTKILLNFSVAIITSFVTLLIFSKIPEMLVNICNFFRTMISSDFTFLWSTFLVVVIFIALYVVVLLIIYVFNKIVCKFEIEYSNFYTNEIELRILDKKINDYESV